MGLFIRRVFWFILVLASGLVAALIAAKQYGINIDLNAWAKIPGLHEISGVTEVINKIPVLLDYPIIKSHGFNGSLAFFLVFLLIFTISLRSSRNKETEAVDTPSIKADLETDSAPDSFAETFDGSNTANEFIAETNSDAVVGTDGKVYDGTATFSGTDTYGHIDSRSQFYTGDDADHENDDDEEAEDDILAQTPSSVADEGETGLSHLTDVELKSKTLDFVEKIRSFEADYQRSRDKTTAELTDFSSDDNLSGALQDVKDTYEQRQEAFSSEFESKYRPVAVAVRQEISKRLGISEPNDNFTPALDRGMLAGINPLTDAADLIEELVEKLA
jgi:hypothetical protein